MLPGKRDFYRCCKARRSASHVNKEFWQQFQNYAPPSLRGYKNKICTYHNIYIYDSRLNRPESVSLASLARQLMCHYDYMNLKRYDYNYAYGKKCNDYIACVSMGLNICILRRPYLFPFQNCQISISSLDNSI